MLMQKKKKKVDYYSIVRDLLFIDHDMKPDSFPTSWA
jgi:hypothetical protein